MTTKLYTVDITLAGDVFCVGNFISRATAIDWAGEVARRMPGAHWTCQHAGDGLCGPRDLESLFEALRGTWATVEARH